MKLRRLGGFVLSFLIIGLATPLFYEAPHPMLSVVSPTALGDPWNTLWMRSSNDSYSAVTTSVGAVFVAGTTSSSLEVHPPINDILLVKYDPEGEPQWNRTWQTSYDKTVNDLLASVNSLYIAGQTETEVNGTNGLLIKLDFDGGELWNVSFGGSLNEGFTCLALGADGIYVGGYSTNTSSGQTSALVVKFNFNGFVVWNETWCFLDPITRATDIALGSDGGYLVGALEQVWGVIHDPFLLKFSFTGIEMWNLTSLYVSSQRYSGITVFNDTVYVTGTSFSSLEDSPVLLLELFNSSGGSLWTQEDEMGLNHEGFGLHVLEDDVFVGGVFEDPSAGYRVSLLHFNQTGELNWKRIWGGAGNCQPFAFSSAVDSLYFAGATSGWLTPSTNGFLVKFSLDGASAPGPVELTKITLLNPYGSFIVPWTPAFDPDGVIEDYELQMDTTPLFDRPDITWIINATSHIIYNRPIGTYYFRVRARDNQDLYGPWSNVAMVIIELVPPVLFNPWLAPAVLALGILIILAGFLFTIIRRGRLE
ncbi:MAG: fibronectin type III domain-containing protein [Candidatus Hodarchaeota archaeon]